MRAAAVVVLLVALVARLVGLTSESLWFDEGHSLLVAHMAPAEAVASLARDVHPPLYFLALGGWVRVFGDSDAALRSLSVLFGMVAVAATMALGRRLGGARAGMVSGLLAAVSPFLVAASQEIRPYSLLFALAALSTLALLRLADRPESWARRATYSLALAALLYTHAVALFVGLVQATWVVVRVARPRPGDAPGLLRGAFLAAVGALVLFAPWVPTLFHQAERVSDHWWNPRPGWKEVRRAAVAHGGGELALACLSALALSGLLLRAPNPSADRPRRLGALLWGVPFLGALLVSLVGPAIFLPRTTEVSILGLLLLAGIGAARAAPEGLLDAPRWRSASALALVVAALGFSGRTLVVQIATRFNEDLRGAVRIVEERARPGDAIVVGHWFERAVVDHYARRSDLAIVSAKDDPPPGARTLWVVVSIHTASVPPSEAALLDRGFYPAGVDRLRRVDLRRYDR